jgi:hypothetical protein
MKCIKLPVFLAFCLLALTAKAQFLQDRITGRPFFEQQYVDIQGSPYLLKDWTPALVTYADGLQLKGVKVKFDIYQNQLVFLKNDSVYEFVQEVVEFVLYPPGTVDDSMVFRKNCGTLPEEHVSPDTYLQVIADGKLPLYKRHYCTLEEISQYANATLVKQFSNKKTAYIVPVNSRLERWKRSSGILKLGMKDQWKAVETYMKQNNLGYRNDEDMVQVFKYYNSLAKAN